MYDCFTTIFKLEIEVQIWGWDSVLTRDDSDQCRNLRITTIANGDV